MAHEQNSLAAFYVTKHLLLALVKNKTLSREEAQQLLTDAIADCGQQGFRGDFEKAVAVMSQLRDADFGPTPHPRT